MAARLPMNEWAKALRAEIGSHEGRERPISQGDLAELVGVGLSAVGKWEMAKNPQMPERDSYVKLLSLASAELRARAPQDLHLPSSGVGLKSGGTNGTPHPQSQRGGIHVAHPLVVGIVLAVKHLDEPDLKEIHDQVIAFVAAHVTSSNPQSAVSELAGTGTAAKK